MNDKIPDISGLLSWDEGLPYPQWELIQTVIESDRDQESRRAAWCSVGRQWLSLLASALGSSYATTETGHFQVLAPATDGYGDSLIQHADRCRTRLFSALPGVADLETPGKLILIILRNQEDY